MLDAEIKSFDALQVTLIDLVLAARPMRFRSTQELPHDIHGAFEHVQTRNTEVRALRQQLGAQLGIDQGKENQAGITANVFDRALQLALAAHQRIGMFVDDNAFELRQSRLGDRVQRFSCRIGDEMNVKTIHGNDLQPSTAGQASHTALCSINVSVCAWPLPPQKHRLPEPAARRGCLDASS